MSDSADGLVGPGIGNILLQDDGLGVHLVKHLQQVQLAPAVRLVDGGTCTLDTLGLFIDYSRGMVIDVLDVGWAPGTVFKLRPEDIPQYAKNNLSLHDVQILDIVQMAARLGKHPQVIIYGIQPGVVTPGLDLSPELAATLPEIGAFLQQEITTVCMEYNKE